MAGRDLSAELYGSSAATGRDLSAELYGSAETARKSTIGSELVRGGKQLASTIRTSAGALTESPEEAALAGVKRSQAIGEEAGEGASLEAVKKAYRDKGLLSAAGEVASQAPRALAGQVPQLAAMYAGAKLGALAGTAVAPGPGTVIGGVLGAGATLLPQFFGSNVERQASEQLEKNQPIQIDRGSAATAAAGQAALEAAGTAFVLGKRIIKGALGLADDAALATLKSKQAITQAAERSLAAAAGRGLAKGAVVEIPVEIAQSVIERAQAGLDVTSSEALNEYGEVAYQAGLVGGSMGAISGPVDTTLARRDVRNSLNPPPPAPPPATPPLPPSAPPPAPLSATPPAPPTVPPITPAPPRKEPDPLPPDDLTREREQEQKDILDLESGVGQGSGDIKPPTPQNAGLADLIKNQAPSSEYETPEQGMREVEAFGNDLVSVIIGERDSYGRAALNNRGLTAKYADLVDSWAAASDAARIAFAENDYSVFKPYETYFKKTAGVLQSQIIKNQEIAKADAEALAQMGKPFTAAEEMGNAPAPDSIEVSDLLAKQQLAVEDIERLSKRTSGTSLMKVLQGSLTDGEISELGGSARQIGKQPFISLVARKGKPGSSMEDMVNKGSLDLFLPIEMRPGQAGYENDASAEYIRERLRAGEFYTDDTRSEIDKIQRGIWDIEDQIKQELSLEEINREIQYAVDEQRGVDREASEASSGGTPDTPAESPSAKAKRDQDARLEQERLEKERLEKERLERERLEKERLEKERTEKERLEKERLEKARQEKQRLENERLINERLERERIAEEERVAEEERKAQSLVINTPEERKAAIAQLRRALNNTVPNFNSRGADGRVTPYKPTALTRILQIEILKLSNMLLDLGMPAAVLRYVKSAGSTRANAIAAMVGDQGWLLIESQWKKQNDDVKLGSLVHELGHAVDGGASTISNSPKWDTAHNELKYWYDNTKNKLGHPLNYPFDPLFKNKVRIKAETLAQAFRYYFTSPDALRANAPEAYSQIQAIVEGIANEQQRTRPASPAKAKTSGNNVQPARDTAVGKDQSRTGAVVPAVGTTERVSDRGSEEVIDLNEVAAVDSPKFKKFFGDSVVVDENGEPLVMYHGTSQSQNGEAFTFFDTYGSNYGLMGMGAYFTDNPEVASSYTTKGKGGTPTVYPVFLSIKNPLDMDAEADADAWTSQFDDIDQYHDGGTTNESWYRAAEELLTDQQMPLYEGAEIMQDGIRAMGFDGITHIGGGRIKSDGVKHRVFIAFEPTQIKSATGNDGNYDTNNPGIIFSINPSPITGEISERAPSVTRRAKTLSRANRAGKISDGQFVAGVNQAIDDAEAAKDKKPQAERQRGADFIRQRLLEAKRRGDLSEEAVDLAEWFIQNNPQLVDDLGISIVTSKREGVGGSYNTFARIMILMKEAGNDQTPVHEILHHLERMMPPEMRSAIRKEWAKQLTQAKEKAATPDERTFFELLFTHHYHGDGSQSDFDKAVEMIKDGKVPYEFYQFVNPSEFWAVNGSEIMQGRFDAVRGGLLQRLKNWVKELMQTIKSVFGASSKAPLMRALNSLSKGDGEFITSDMLSQVTGYDAIAGKNVLGQRPLVNYTVPDSTNLDTFIYNLQDKQVDLKRVTQAIKENVGTIDERFDAYMKETLFSGRASTQTKRFLQNELEPLFKEMGRLGVTVPDFEEFLHNRHAEERNAQIALVNQGMPDKGSGIETIAAQDYLNNLPADEKTKYEKLAGMVDVITLGTRQLLVDSGLESQETINTWESTYDNYVPLNRDDVDYSSAQGTGVGQGYSVRGPASKRAVGSERKVVDILANIAIQRERNIVRAEKNRVALALYGLAIKNPNPNFFLAVNPDAKQNLAAATKELVNMGFLPSDIQGLMNEPTNLEIDPSTGLAVQRTHQMQRGADNVMGLRVNGENRYVFFNQNDDRAKRMATSIKNLDADKLGYILSTTAEITRFIAAMNTQYNPIFGMYNFLRDVSTAGLQLSNTPLAGKQTQVLSPTRVFGAMLGIYTDLRAERKGKAGTSKYSVMWEEYQQRGGQTGFRDQFSSTEKRGQALQRIVDPSSWADSGLGKIFTINGALKVPFEAARKSVAKPMFDFLSDYNETLENAVRLSAYEVAIQNGMSKDAAAVLAKELTVNFNRKGQIATQAGALYAFFNASVQGTTALIRTLSGPAGKAIIKGGLMMGAIQAVLFSMAGFDEDEPKEFIREKNFVIPIGEGKYLAIPLPLGYNVIPNTSRLITEAIIRFVEDKKVKPTETAFKIFESLLGAFNPIGNAGWSFQTVAPTVADPIVALMENKNWTGQPIARKDFNALDPTPGFTRYKESSTTFSRGLSEFMNAASGGTQDAPGKISPTPDQIDFLIGQIFGGVGREAMKIERTVRSVITGEELPSYSVPLVGRFYGDTTDSSATSNKFYKNIEQMNIHENSIKGMRKRGENVQPYLKENPDARMFEEANRVERVVQNLRKQRRKLVEESAPKEAVKLKEKAITKQMSRLNELIKQREMAESP